MVCGVNVAAVVDVIIIIVAAAAAAAADVVVLFVSIECKTLLSLHGLGGIVRGICLG